MNKISSPLFDGKSLPSISGVITTTFLTYTSAKLSNSTFVKYDSEPCFSGLCFAMTAAPPSVLKGTGPLGKAPSEEMSNCQAGNGNPGKLSKMSFSRKKLLSECNFPLLEVDEDNAWSSVPFMQVELVFD